MVSSIDSSNFEFFVHDIASVTARRHTVIDCELDYDFSRSCLAILGVFTCCSLYLGMSLNSIKWTATVSTSMSSFTWRACIFDMIYCSLSITFIPLQWLSWRCFFQEFNEFIYSSFTFIGSESYLLSRFFVNFSFEILQHLFQVRNERLWIRSHQILLSEDLFVKFKARCITRWCWRLSWFRFLFLCRCSWFRFLFLCRCSWLRFLLFGWCWFLCNRCSLYI